MKNIGIEIKWGIIFILSGLIWMTLEKSLGWHDVHIDQHATYTMLYAPIAIAIYVFALLDKKNHFYQGKMTYGQGFKSGMIITLVVVILSPLSQYLTIAVISPDFFTNMIQYSVETGAMTQEAAEANFNLNNYLIMSVIGAAGLGFVTSAVVAFFTRSKS